MVLIRVLFCTCENVFSIDSFSPETLPCNWNELLMLFKHCMLCLQRICDFNYALVGIFCSDNLSIAEVILKTAKERLVTELFYRYHK